MITHKQIMLARTGAGNRVYLGEEAVFICDLAMHPAFFEKKRK